MELRDVYNGPNADLFFNTLEHSIEITENILTHLDGIHVRVFKLFIIVVQHKSLIPPDLNC